MQARGLKPLLKPTKVVEPESRLMQARGLKQLQLQSAHLQLPVAPHAGAWIETVKEKLTVFKPEGRASCRRVD